MLQTRRVWHVLEVRKKRSIYVIHMSFYNRIVSPACYICSCMLLNCMEILCLKVWKTSYIVFVFKFFPEVSLVLPILRLAHFRKVEETRDPGRIAFVHWENMWNPPTATRARDRTRNPWSYGTATIPAAPPWHPMLPKCRLFTGTTSQQYWTPHST